MATIESGKKEYRKMIHEHADAIWESCGGGDDEEQMKQLLHEAADVEVFWFEECLKILRHSDRLVENLEVRELVNLEKFDFVAVVQAAAYLAVRGDIAELLSAKKMKQEMGIS